MPTTVTGYTATRMKAIEDASIVSGAVLLDDLILTRNDGTTVNAGNVRGAQGIQGIQGIQGVPGIPGIAIVTSGTRPATPIDGQYIYETDTNSFLSWDGATWTLPNNVAGGTLAYGQRVTDIGPATFATSTDLDSTALVVSFTLSSTRRVRITGAVRSVSATAANARLILQIRRASDNGVIQEQVMSAHVATGVGGRGGQVVCAPLLAAGSHSFKLSALAADSASFTIGAATTYPAMFLAEDIGGI